MSDLINVSESMESMCRRAVAVWGQDEQLRHSMGELGEYIASAGRFFQGRDPDFNELVDEAADVINLMMQVRELVGHQKFDDALTRKFEKFSLKVELAEKKKSQH